MSDPPNPASEEALVARATAGDTSATDRLLLAHYRRLSARIGRKIPSECSGTIAADDELQETFAEVFRRLGSFRTQGEQSFYRWLATIAELRLADMVKAARAAKRGGGRKAAQAAGNPEAGSVVNLLDLAAAHERTPSRSVARHEAASAIHVAMAGLKGDYREALQLRYLKGLPVAEIAKQMNRTERARKDIAGWRRDVLVKTRGAQFGIRINDGDIRFDASGPASPDFVMVCEDPRTLLDGLAYRGAITDSVINKKLWISKNMEFNTIFKLDRMARSVARSKKS